MKRLLIASALLLNACSLPWSSTTEAYFFDADTVPASPSLNDVVTARFRNLPKAQYEATLEVVRYSNSTRDSQERQVFAIDLEKFNVDTEGASRDISVNLASTFVSTNQTTLTITPNDRVWLFLAMVDGPQKRGSGIGIY